MVGMISILMAAYNAEKTIKTAIESVLAQTYDDWELIVVNDCSKDKTQAVVSEIAARDSRVRLINNETNLGVSITRKKGAAAAKGTWIAVLDSDDMWKPDKLEKQMRLVNDKNAELVFTGSGFIDNEGSPIDWQLHVPETLSYRELLKQNLVSNSSVLVKKELYEQFYVVDDSIYNDFAMWLQIIKAGYKVCGLDDPLLIYRLSRGSRSRNKIKSAIRTWNTYRYIGLNLIEAVYFMCWYAVRGLRKYRKLR